MQLFVCVCPLAGCWVGMPSSRSPFESCIYSLLGEMCSFNGQTFSISTRLPVRHIYYLDGFKTISVLSSKSHAVTLHMSPEIQYPFSSMKWYLCHQGCCKELTTFFMKSLGPENTVDISYYQYRDCFCYYPLR